MPSPESGIDRSQFEFSVSSVLAAASETVWKDVSTMAGVNAELWPFVRMTSPGEAEHFNITDAPLGQRAFRSWILLFGVLPIDYDDLTFVRIQPGVSFVESSPMLSQRRWEHERTLEVQPGGCRLTDRIRFEPRIRGIGALLRPVFRLAFVWRHRRLRLRYAARP